MNKLILGSLIALNFLHGYELDFSKEFYKKVQSDILTAQIRINVNSKDESFINSVVEDYQYFIKHDKLVEKKNGAYTITPKYYYKSGKSYFQEYQGILSYQLETKSSEELNEFVTEIYTIKDKQRLDNTKLSISNIHWKVSKERYDDAINTLRFEAIKWIEIYAKNLRRDCSIKNISLDKVGENTPPFARVMSMQGKSELNITPTNESKNIKLYASYKLECK